MVSAKLDALNWHFPDNSRFCVHSRDFPVFRQDRLTAGTTAVSPVVANQRKSLEIFLLNRRTFGGMVTMLSVIVSLLSFRFRRRASRELREDLDERVDALLDAEKTG